MVLYPAIDNLKIDAAVERQESIIDSDTRSGSGGSVEGQVFILFALFALVLVGVMALAVDVGYLLAERRQAQVAADAAALAGASELRGGGDSTQVTLVSKHYADENGIDLTSDIVIVDVDGDQHDGLVTVDVEVAVPRFFLGAVYSGPWEVSAHAVAEVVNFEDANYALIALESPGIYINGASQVSVLGGSIMSNDDIYASGDDNTITTEGYLDAAGTISAKPSWSAANGIRPFLSPIADPFAAVAPPVPNPDGLEVTADINCPSTCTLYPGYYQDVNIKIGGVATLTTGTYYFEDSSIELNGAGASISGAGVTLYFTGSPLDAFFNPSNGIVNLTTLNWPTPDGDYGDMAIWIDNCSPFNASGDGDLFIGGVLYAPCSKVYLHGNPDAEAINGMVVAGMIDIVGDSEFIVSYSPFAATEAYNVYLSE